MELKIPVEELSKALYRTQGIVERKTTNPVLANVLLEAKKDGGLTVSAFDMEIGLIGQHRCEVLKEGAVALPARHLYDIVRSLPAAQVSLKRAANGQVEIQSGSARFKIVATPAEDYPALPKPEGQGGFEIAADVLAQMIERTAFAISTDETRYNLGGVYLEQADKGALRMVATDGHRLSLVDRQVSGSAKLDKGVLIPKKGLLELRRLLGEDGGACQLGFTKGSAVFKRDGVVMIMRLLDGQFPDYRQVVPKESEKSVTVGRSALSDTLKRISLIASDKTSGIRLDLASDHVSISSQNPDLGEAQEDLPAKVVGEGLKIGFNARYLIEALAVLACDEVRLELSDELSPGVLRGIGEEGYLAVVMPMRI
ncbi:MAG TPA: DNA polymerase III subunit beta [Myxococcales bacterium]|jgi:DNA polymerase III subunit beta|nr:DNA polymerase III subunit beta [Myxococcales bacterium]